MDKYNNNILVTQHRLEPTGSNNICDFYKFYRLQISL